MVSTKCFQERRDKAIPRGVATSQRIFSVRAENAVEREGRWTGTRFVPSGLGRIDRASSRCRIRYGPHRSRCNMASFIFSYGVHASTIRILIPLTVSDDVLDEGPAALERALGDARLIEGSAHGL
jgi:hypothetical protein